MKYAWGTLILVGSMLVGARTVRAQQSEYDNHDVNSCVRTFYDPDEYQWLAFENTCSETIVIVYGKKGDDQSVQGETTLRPGKKSNIGRSRKEVAEWGGVSWYVCPEGTEPRVDGEYPDRTGSRYGCKRS